MVAPARSLAAIPPAAVERARRSLEATGLSVKFSPHCFTADDGTDARAKKVDDIHLAFEDRSTDAILTAIGGFDSNQLLPHLDFDLIRANPKIFCGFSDITALSCAMYAKAGLVTYSGPHFMSFSVSRSLPYIMRSFTDCLMQEAPFTVIPSSEWTDGPWLSGDERLSYEQNSGALSFRAGEATGRLIGGNLCTLNLLQGTSAMPSLADHILFVEEDDTAGTFTLKEFERNLHSILQQPAAQELRGLIIGRFQRSTGASPDALERIIQKLPLPSGLPVVYGFDFGHTLPVATIPVGGTGALSAVRGSVTFSIIGH